MIRRGDVLLRGESLWRVLMRLRHAASLLQVVPVQQLLLTTDEGQGPSARALRGAMEGSTDSVCINIYEFTALPIQLNSKGVST